eukprot:2225406-Rhodomonas_salina.2
MAEMRRAIRDKVAPSPAARVQWRPMMMVCDGLRGTVGLGLRAAAEGRRNTAAHHHPLRHADVRYCR